MIILLFANITKIEEFAKRSFDSKLKDLKELKDKLELFYYDTIIIKPNNEHKIKDLEEIKVALNTALELYNKLLIFIKLNIINFQKPRRKA